MFYPEVGLPGGYLFTWYRALQLASQLTQLALGHDINALRELCRDIREVNSEFL